MLDVFGAGQSGRPPLFLHVLTMSVFSLFVFLLVDCLLFGLTLLLRLQVNKQRLMQTEILHDGDVLRIGADNVFKFACGGPQAQNGAAPSDPKNMSAVNESRSSNIRMPSDYGALQIPRYPYEASRREKQTGEQLQRRGVLMPSKCRREPRNRMRRSIFPDCKCCVGKQAEPYDFVGRRSPSDSIPFPCVVL
ncbi:unnamed protein product [Caenorhabditis auriculariae]|uniref:Uncharacterized protein n=1 Tax=Caenorhabditis auriculariae TaxID=2777116 RepID=A0A8S1H618_9PELO|nr:unnamed protein product [Caenorhabditis auriculariae]